MSQERRSLTQRAFITARIIVCCAIPLSTGTGHAKDGQDADPQTHEARFRATDEPFAIQWVWIPNGRFL
jgi:hypothetical protein